MQPAAQSALGIDIRMLGDLLGQTIRRLSGEDSFQMVEEVRSATKELRAEPSLERARQLRDRLGQLELPTLRVLIRAFSVYFDLINLAEQQARVRSLRLRAATKLTDPRAETAEAALNQIKAKGIGLSELAEHLAAAEVVPVFTAHPSEARRRTILEKLAHVAQQLDRLEYGQLVEFERIGAIGEIAEEIEGIWLSDAVRFERPTVLGEVRQVLGVVEDRLLDVVPHVYRKLENALVKVYPDWSGSVPPFLRFGSWIGGDRDGHPNVTHDVTAAALKAQQETILRYYLERLEELGRRLSHSNSFLPPREIFRESLQEDAKLFPDLTVPKNEPYRAKCRYITAKLERTLEFVQSAAPDWSRTDQDLPMGIYRGRAALLKDLRLVEDELSQAGALATAQGAVHDLRCQVEVFGLHLLQLDVRQHSSRHASAVAESLAAAKVCENYLALSPDERFAVLAAELESQRPLIPAHLDFSPETVEVILTFRTMAAFLERQCPEAMSPYIISSTTEPAHLLEVLLLAREARLFRPQQGLSLIDIIPLFEALEPLRSGREILAKLFALPIYRRQLELRQNLQEVMIGYSDSNKESGFLQSAWALYRAQEEIATLGKQTNITIRFFHGRGGAIGRGGGPANHAILAQPQGTVDGRLRMTEQGEMIADRFGHPAIAERHLEQILNAVLRTSFPSEAGQPDPAWLSALDEIADRARQAYRGLVYENPEFESYFEQATCIGEIARLKIGSRPARRSKASSIDQLRAIPWVFSWMQSRHTLPGWFGLGSAITGFLAQRADGLEMLKEMYARWPFWTTLIDNAQMILAKADMTIARLYADLVEDQDLAARIYGAISSEYEASVEAVCQITGQKVLLERSPILQTSIDRRNPYVDPLSFIQLVLLRRLRSAASSVSELETAVLESINGVASGLKNTG